MSFISLYFSSVFPSPFFSLVVLHLLLLRNIIESKLCHKGFVNDVQNNSERRLASQFCKDICRYLFIFLLDTSCLGLVRSDFIFVHNKAVVSTFWSDSSYSSVKSIQISPDKDKLLNQCDKIDFFCDWSFLRSSHTETQLLQSSFSAVVDVFTQK